MDHRDSITTEKILMPKITANSDFDHLLALQKTLIQSQRDIAGDEKMVNAILAERLPLLSFGVQRALQEKHIDAKRLIDPNQAMPIGTSALTKKREYFSQLYRSDLIAFVNQHFALSAEQLRTNAASTKEKASTKKVSVSAAQEATNTTWPMFNRLGTTLGLSRNAVTSSNAVTTTTHNPLLNEHQQNNDYGLLLALQAKVAEQKNPTLPLPRHKMLQHFALVPSYYLEKDLFEQLSERVQNLLKKEYVSARFVFRPNAVDHFLQLTPAQLAAMTNFNLSTLHENTPIVEPESAIDTAITAADTTTSESADATVVDTETAATPLPTIVEPAPATFIDASAMEIQPTPPLTSLSATAASMQAAIGHHLTTDAALSSNVLTADDVNFDAIELTTVRTRSPV